MITYANAMYIYNCFMYINCKCNIYIGSMCNFYIYIYIIYIHIDNYIIVVDDNHGISIHVFCRSIYTIDMSEQSQKKWLP